MNFKDLPKEYKELAERNTKAFFLHVYKEERELFFNWESTPEGGIFWALCKLAKTISELPPLPNSQSIDEVKEAVKFIENFNKWRTGAPIEQPLPSEITKNLNILIGFVKEKIQ